MRMTDSFAEQGCDRLFALNVKSIFYCVYIIISRRLTLWPTYSALISDRRVCIFARPDIRLRAELLNFVV